MSEYQESLKRLGAPITKADLPGAMERLIQSKRFTHKVVYALHPPEQYMRDTNIITQMWLAGALPLAPPVGTIGGG